MDERDYRVRIDLTFAPQAEGVARGLYLHAKNQLGKAVNINPGALNQEISFVEIERCGHRIGEGCELIEKTEV